MSTEKITIAGIEIDLIRKDIKNIHLAVYPPTGRVRIAAPERVENESIRLYAISKLSWIKKHQKKFKEQSRQTPREYVSGESHYLFGERFLLNVIDQKGRNKVKRRNNKYLDLYVRPGSTMMQRQLIMREWYRKELKKQIPSLMSKWEARIGVQSNDWGVRRMRTKWGTCNIEANRIWVNLELTKKPLICLEYIIAHELIHLLERNHTQRFMALMDRYMPNWRLHRNTLNRMPVSHEDWGY